MIGLWHRFWGWLNSCRGCARRFEAVLKGLGFKKTKSGYALPVSNRDLEESPYLITWETIYSRHASGVIEAADLWRRWKARERGGSDE